jgi:3-oxoacyl-[acyl-carrier-protein] synthase II
VHNAAAANISIMLKATGPNLTVSQFDLSVPSALLAARQWLAEGRVDRVLFGAVDELSPLLGYVACRSRGVPATSTMAPLRSSQETAIMGEGAAFLLLSRGDGKSDGYCTIEEVTTGSLQAGALPLPADALLVLGADGRREQGDRYRALVPPTARIACYSPLYGSMPAGPAFDLAAAALILQGGTVFPSPAGADTDLPGTLARHGALPSGVRVASVILDGDNGCGVVTLGRS